MSQSLSTSPVTIALETTSIADSGATFVLQASPVCFPILAINSIAQTSNISVHVHWIPVSSGVVARTLVKSSPAANLFFLF